MLLIIKLNGTRNKKKKKSKDHHTMVSTWCWIYTKFDLLLQTAMQLICLKV